MQEDTVYALLEALSGCRSTDPSVEAQIVVDIVIATDDLCGRIAHRHCRYAGLDWGRDADDLISLVREAELSLLADIAAGDKDALACVPGFEAGLFTRGHSAIRAYADSVAVTGVSGYTGVKRRQRALVQHQRRIQESGVEPLSPSELVADWNATVASMRKNPRKQGAFAVEADVANPVRVYPQDPHDLSAMLPATTPIESVETADAIRRTVILCEAQDATLGQVASLWFAWYPDGEMATTQEIANQLSISSRSVRQCIHRIQSAFRKSLLDG
ncbi:MAG: helix-turn-helix domain-containing protein [Acidimicrobiales bacterium]